MMNRRSLFGKLAAIMAAAPFVTVVASEKVAEAAPVEPLRYTKWISLRGRASEAGRACIAAGHTSEWRYAHSTDEWEIRHQTATETHRVVIKDEGWGSDRMEKWLDSLHEPVAMHSDWATGMGTIYGDFVDPNGNINVLQMTAAEWNAEYRSEN